MFERFTERARQVVVLAQEEARSFHHESIDVPHILSGLLMEEEGIAARVLEGLEFKLDSIHAVLYGPKQDAPLNGQIPLTKESKRVFEGALRKALALGHSYIGTEHLLLSLVRFCDKKTHSFLKEELGIQAVEVIELEVDELLRGPKKPRAISQTQETQQEAREAQDLIADFLTGFKRWRDERRVDGDFNDADEMFVRWIEASKLAELL